MRHSNITLTVLRDLAALVVVAVFVFPVFWWGLTSIKPDSAIFSLSGLNWFDFVPTLAQYEAMLGGFWTEALDPRAAMRDSALIGLAVTAVTLALALLAAFGLTLMRGHARRHLVNGMLLFRILPPIALAVPAFAILNDFGLFNTRGGVVIMHVVLVLPLSILLLNSFMQEIPVEVLQAARIDGASNSELLFRIILPQIRAGMALTAALSFVFSWTEFMMALFLSVSFRTLPVMMSIVSIGQPGPLSALATASLLPGMVLLLLGQKSLARGMTLGFQK